MIDVNMSFKCFTALPSHTITTMHTICKVLEREGTLKTLRYISPAVSKAVEVDSVARNETAGVDQTSDEANINGAEEAGLVEGSSATTDHCSSHGGLARVRYVFIYTDAIALHVLSPKFALPN